RGTSAAAAADVRGVEQTMDAVRKRDAQMGYRRADTINGLVGELQNKLDSARRLRLARDRWIERVGVFHAYLAATAAVTATLRSAHDRLDDIKRLAGSEANDLVGLATRLADCSRMLSTISVPDELKPAHSLLVSALTLAETAVRTRRQAVVSGEIKAAWEAS